MPRLLAVAAVASPGGAEVVMARLLRRLGGRGWHVTLATPGPGPLADLAAEEDWFAASLPVGGLARGTGARAVASFPKARVLASRHDVVLLNGSVAGRLLPAVRGAARTALFVHDLVDRVPSHWESAAVLLANSRATAARLAPLRAEVVGVPVELPAPAPPPWRTDRPVVGFVGRLEPAKGPLDLIRAAPAIARARPDARIVVVGSDPFTNENGYRAAVRAALCVEHFDRVDDAAAVLPHLDVLVVPSRVEGLGMVAAEALAAGTPVVATRIGGLPEVVEDGVTGALVTPNRPHELAAAVVRVLGRSEEMGATAKRRAGRFSAEAFVNRVEPLLA